MIANLADAPLSSRDGSYGGMAGFKDGILYENAYWIIKYPKSTAGLTDVAELSYVSSPLSEYLGSHIYEILGYDVHETMLCFRENKIAVACKDFRTDDQQLLEIRTLKNSANEELTHLLETTFVSTSSSHMIDLDEILTHLRMNRNLKDVPGIIERFWDMLVVDILINNNDRNNGNWGILRDNAGSRLAPIFDNGAAFNSKTPDSKLYNLLQNEDLFERSVLNGATTFSREGKRISAHQMLNLDIPELRMAIQKNVPKIQSNLEAIKGLIEAVPYDYTTPTGKVLSVCTDIRKEFYIRSIQMRFDKMLWSIYRKLC